MLRILSILSFLSLVSAFSPISSTIESKSTALSAGRRDFLLGGFLVAPAVLLPSLPANAAEGEKVLVLGGTGFVGSRVVELLKSRGVQVTATSTDGRDGTNALDLTKLPQDLGDKLKGYSAVISCVGAIGTDRDEAVNAGTGLVAKAAKDAGVDRFVYITVSPEVADFAEGIDFLKGYLAGKTSSRKSVLDAFGDKAVLIEPTFIYGGGSFELNPPRVASFYGKFIEGLLSSGPIRTIDRILSPGIIKIALEPPVPVEGVAAAAVAGALGKTMSILDTYDKIKEASNTLQS